MEETKKKYSISFRDVAKKELSKIPEPYFSKIEKAILGLSENPRPNGVKKLKGTENSYRIRVSSYRIVYKIEDKILYIEILTIDHRKDVYKRM